MKPTTEPRQTNGRVAQLVEHGPLTPAVADSNPAALAPIFSTHLPRGLIVAAARAEEDAVRRAARVRLGLDPDERRGLVAFAEAMGVRLQPWQRELAVMLEREASRSRSSS